jgi:hypothetical protein
LTNGLKPRANSVARFPNRGENSHTPDRMK